MRSLKVVLIILNIVFFMLIIIIRTPILLLIVLLLLRILFRLLIDLTIGLDGRKLGYGLRFAVVFVTCFAMFHGIVMRVRNVMNFFI